MIEQFLNATVKDGSPEFHMRARGRFTLRERAASWRVEHALVDGGEPGRDQFPVVPLLAVLTGMIGSYGSRAAGGSAR
jgi:hypothetical protein